MSLNLIELNHAIQSHGRVVRIVVAQQAGSTPREVGASMLVWSDGQSGTIGGGALEHDAVQTARDQIVRQKSRQFMQRALGPDLGQCCGGNVNLLFELFNTTPIAEPKSGLFARPVSKNTGKMPTLVKHYIDQANRHPHKIYPALIDNWMIEPITVTQNMSWIWGAGHVGRAVVHAFAAMPDIELTWVDTTASRFPDEFPHNVTIVPQSRPAELCPHIPPDVHHYILTYSHSMDLKICDGLLKRGFRYAGLIGSGTKWARFHKRLSEMGHSSDQVNRIKCPIGEPRLGKDPAHIAIGVVHEFLRRSKMVSPSVQ